jgi:16S rRNA (uracil1498-N3)-methyltransferase
MRINCLTNLPDEDAGICELPRDEAHHLARVLRVTPGQEITLFDGRGGVAEAVVRSVAKQRVEVEILRRWQVPAPSVRIELFQALPKPDRWDLILQKSVELGVSAIHPMLTRHTQFTPTPKKEIRWQKIITAAAQQCEVRWLPELSPAKKMAEWLNAVSDCDLAFIGSLEPDARPFQEVLDGLPKVLPEGARVAVLIGPEGDFSAEELRLARDAGAVPVSLGNRILRTETAAFFMLSVLACKWL